MTRLAQRAVELGKDDAIAIAASGCALVFVVRDLKLGAALIDRALVLNSNLAEAWNWGGWVKNWLGQPESAIERFAHAMRLSPHDPQVMNVQSGTAYAHFLLGHYDEAASWAAVTLQDNPGYQTGLRLAAASNAMAGRPEQAHKAIDRLRQLNPTLRVSNLKGRAGSLSACRRSCAIRRSTTASRAARMTIAARCSPEATRWSNKSADFRFWPQIRSDDRIEQCPSLEAKRKTSARTEYFAL